jgi:hypothetical protein
MKARSKHPQLQHYTRNWATHEIMKTLIKNKRIYKKCIMSEDDDRDSLMLMEDGEESEGGCNKGRDNNNKGNEEENGDNYEREENGDDGPDGEGNTEGEDMYAQGVNADKEERDDIDDSAVGRRAWDLEWKAVAGFGATTSQSVAAKKLKKSAATSKSVGKS